MHVSKNTSQLRTFHTPQPDHTEGIAHCIYVLASCAVMFVVNQYYI